MAEDVGLYWSLFQGQFQDDWKTDPEFVRYLAELSAYSLEKLQLEPEHLKEERRLVLNSTQKLAFNNYQTFIQTADCTREVFKDFIAVEDHVSQLLNRIPDFTDVCKEFTTASQQVNEKRKLNSLALSKHTQLLEVLEIPQVMETCVRNGYYDEALDLSGHVRRMAKKHKAIPIIEGIGRDVERSLGLMLSQLLQQLRGSLQLPACLRVVGFLRRMEVFSDTELRLKFLQARGSWLQGVLKAIPTDDAYQHLSKTIEVSRVHLFDIVTQYRAIFPDDDSGKPSYSSSRAAASSVTTVPGALFYSWVNDKIWQFLHTLEKDLESGVGGRVDSLLGQCMYFGLSLSRIGADFRSLIAPVFVRVLIKSFRQTVRNAKHHFHESMKRLTLSTPLRGSTELSSHTHYTLTPPHSLLDYPPLASLTNALVSAFNELRQCAPLAMGPEVAQELRRLLESIVHDVREYHRIEHGSFTSREKEAYEQLVCVVVRDFLPFLKQVFEAMFKSQSVQSVALSSAYALKNTQSASTTLSGSVFSSKLNLGMELDLTVLADPLRSIVAWVFEEVSQVAKILPDQEKVSSKTAGAEQLQDQEKTATKVEDILDNSDNN